MEAENKTCQNCKKEFIIDAQDFAFYEKISAKGGSAVPAPTWCPECRLQRKMVRRNERTLYKRKCDNCQKEIISIYPQKSQFRIYCNDCWWSDKWDSMDYSQDYNFSKSFFEQFFELSKATPRMALYQKNPVNSEYTNHSDHNKNCYMSFNNGFVENVLYGKWTIKSKDLVDCYSVFNSELIYESQDSDKCSRSKYLLFSNNCLDSAFLYNCKGCSNCFMSSNLRNQSYYFENKQLSKEEYQEKISEIDLGSFEKKKYYQMRFFNEILIATLRKYGILDKIVRSTGDNLYEAKNLKQCFHVSESEDCAFCVDDANLKDCYDIYEAAFNCEMQYDCHACNRVSRSKFSSISYDDHDIEYCEMCHNSSNLFGCVGLRDKQYCILNKQYTKKEYEELVPKIKEHMNSMPYVDKKGRVYKYGEFFPPELSPFCYNETVAQEYFPLTKEQALAQGYTWKDPEERNVRIQIPNDKLPDNIKDVDDSIVGQVIECQHKGQCNQQCTSAFKIIPQELEFYRKMNLPLPRLCPNCRHYQRLKQRNPLKLWHRKCMCGTDTAYKNTLEHFHKDNPCPNEFETSYAPDKPEIVYCEECYKREVN